MPKTFLEGKFTIPEEWKKYYFMSSFIAVPDQYGKQFPRIDFSQDNWHQRIDNQLISWKEFWDYGEQYLEDDYFEPPTEQEVEFVWNELEQQMGDKFDPQAVYDSLRAPLDYSSKVFRIMGDIEYLRGTRKDFIEPIYMSEGVAWTGIDQEQEFSIGTKLHKPVREWDIGELRAEREKQKWNAWNDYIHAKDIESRFGKYAHIHLDPYERDWRFHANVANTNPYLRKVETYSEDEIWDLITEGGKAMDPRKVGMEDTLIEHNPLKRSDPIQHGYEYIPETVDFLRNIGHLGENIDNSDRRDELGFRIIDHNYAKHNYSDDVDESVYYEDYVYQHQKIEHVPVVVKKGEELEAEEEESGKKKRKRRKGKQDEVTSGELIDEMTEEDVDFEDEKDEDGEVEEEEEEEAEEDEEEEEEEEEEEQRRSWVSDEDFKRKPKRNTIQEQQNEIADEQNTGNPGSQSRTKNAARKSLFDEGNADDDEFLEGFYEEDDSEE